MGPARAKTLINLKICGNRPKTEIFEAKSGIFEAESGIFEAKSGIFEAKRPKPNPKAQKSMKHLLENLLEINIFIYFGHIL